MLAGFQPVVLWQASQLAVVCTWLNGLPFAVLPLWQVAQEPELTLLWFMFAGFHAFVLWQVSQLAVVWTWLNDLPFAVLPLWQEAQVPEPTLL